ncbi:hypothetical protein DP129_01145 [Clostridium tetani]|uniref:hypothetical protein n=1 Tax=Clostridium tetani TaxID=1513 RepID=UPI00100AC167|nr:hypothetical protein [Clostridium tetani]RXI41339.1 hypothetical protein DP129_01145 [Clostridium tetani]
MKKSMKRIASFAILGTLAFSSSVFAANKPSVSFFTKQGASGSISVSGGYAYGSTYSEIAASVVQVRIYDEITQNSNEETKDSLVKNKHVFNANTSIKVQPGGYRISGYHYVSAGEAYGTGSTWLRK